MYSLTVNDPVWPKGEVLGVADFPVTLENGKTVKVSAEEVERYETLTGRDFKETAEGINGVTLTATSTAKKKEGDS